MRGLSRHRVCWTLLVAGLAAGCVTRPVERVTATVSDNVRSFPQSLDRKVDLLFVVDDSKSMLGEQRTLVRLFPTLIDALRSPKLGPVGPGATCSEQDPSGCKIPDVHIGVISPDLGAGPYVYAPGCAEVDGLDGRLQNLPRRADCKGPDNPWIAYDPLTNQTNVRSHNADPLQRVIESFSCIAELGANGCLFEQQLEAARRALDPKLGRNPGFLRPDALLTIVFITDEDDCSAETPGLYDIGNVGLGSSNWRCFDAGVQCAGDDETDPRAPGVRTACRPAYNVLRPVTIAQADGTESFSYEQFFKQLKARADGRPVPGRVIMAALAGPPGPVEVVRDLEGQPMVVPSCTFRPESHELSEDAPIEDDLIAAQPAIRIASLIESFSADSGEVPGTFRSICPAHAGDDNFGQALGQVGARIRTALGRQCLSSPLLVRGGGLACYGDEPLDATGQRRCVFPGCLHEVDCQVDEGPLELPAVTVPRCPVDLFYDLAAQTCTKQQCPCWRMAPSPDCLPERDGSPYALQILRAPGTAPAPGTYADITCSRSLYRWGSDELFAALDEDQDGVVERICR